MTPNALQQGFLEDVLLIILEGESCNTSSELRFFNDPTQNIQQFTKFTKRLLAKVVNSLGYSKGVFFL